MTDGKDPIERALELAVYAPIGIGLYLKDVAPTLVNMFVARGRAEMREIDEPVIEAASGVPRYTPSSVTDQRWPSRSAR
jgi:hypothetical protein